MARLEIADCLCHVLHVTAACVLKPNCSAQIELSLRLWSKWTNLSSVVQETNNNRCWNLQLQFVQAACAAKNDEFLRSQNGRPFTRVRWQTWAHGGNILLPASCRWVVASRPVSPDARSLHLSGDGAKMADIGGVRWQKRLQHVLRHPGYDLAIRLLNGRCNLSASLCTYTPRCVWFGQLLVATTVQTNDRRKTNQLTRTPPTSKPSSTVCTIFLFVDFPPAMWIDASPNAPKNCITAECKMQRALEDATCCTAAMQLCAHGDDGRCERVELMQCNAGCALNVWRGRLFARPARKRVLFSFYHALECEREILPLSRNCHTGGSFCTSASVSCRGVREAGGWSLTLKVLNKTSCTPANTMSLVDGRAAHTPC